MRAAQTTPAPLRDHPDQPLSTRLRHLRDHLAAHPELVAPLESMADAARKLELFQAAALAEHEEQERLDRITKAPAASVFRREYHA